MVVTTKSGNVGIDLSNLFDAAFHSVPGASKGEPMLPGVMLINGSLIPGPVMALDDPVKVGKASFPLSSVAWVIFQTAARDKISLPSSGQTGVILPDGEFFPGMLGGIKDNRVAVNSLLLGPQRFSIKGKPDIIALVLRDIQETGGRYEVSVKGGPMYLVNDIKFDHDNILIHDEIVGDVQININTLNEIRLAPRQYQALANLKPDHVEMPPGMDAATALHGEQSAGDPDQQNLQTAAGVSVTYTVPQGYTLFFAGAKMPPGSPPGALFTFSVYGDTKFALARTTSVAVGDDPQHLRVPIVNSHAITLRVESATPGAARVAAEWIQPMFMRP